MSHKTQSVSCPELTGWWWRPSSYLAITCHRDSVTEWPWGGKSVSISWADLSLFSAKGMASWRKFEDIFATRYGGKLYGLRLDGWKTTSTIPGDQLSRNFTTGKVPHCIIVCSHMGTEIRWTSRAEDAWDPPSCRTRSRAVAGHWATSHTCSWHSRCFSEYVAGPPALDKI